MISRMAQWVKRKVQGKPYDPKADPIVQMLTEAKDHASQAAKDSRESVRQNMLEAAILHDRLHANGGNGERYVE